MGKFSLNDNKSFCFSLSDLRNDKGISQRELARKIGISQPSVKKIESNINDIRISSLKKYISALGMTLTIQAESDDNGKTFLLKQDSIMSNQEDEFFKKLSEKRNLDNENKEKEMELIKNKKEKDKRDLIKFRDETDALFKSVSEMLNEKIKSRLFNTVVSNDYHQCHVLSLELVCDNIAITFTPTGPRFGCMLGNGVVQISSNSYFFRKYPYIELSLILKVKDDTHWVIHTRDSRNGEWTQEKLDKQSLFKLLNELIFVE